MTTRARGHSSAGPLTYAALALVTAVSLFPLLWTAVAASHDSARLARTPPPLWFGGHLPHNLRVAWTDAGLGLALANTVLVAGTVALGTVLCCTVAGFAFARLRFRGSRPLLLLTVGTMMVPPQLGVVPLFLLMARLGWAGELRAVVLPALVSAFGVFFMRQYLSGALPAELVEAARVDGAHTGRVVWHVVLPAARPAMVVLGMLSFVQSWNDFFWPVVALTQENPTVQVALTGLGRGYVPDQAVVMAGALLGTLPLLLAFALLGRRITGGVMQGALKG
ncbi:sugar ABC transporter permease [Streptomyces mashuensis]|uniref:Sugar ABC transporter permease n=1 Tax=Streptomyces mashuensis TaxID=33904 RepID=A0A919B0V6_9ACTN|nr:carbohydrate ABC transporter permease [Streptomyces mashuensis]GHF36343.1 sugar ABC transporter permease [Streptomyces mashuensis]